jgi:hypothetical protein
VCNPFFCRSYTRLNRPGLYSWHDPISCTICCAVCMSRDLRERCITPSCDRPTFPDDARVTPTTRSDHSCRVICEFTQPITAKYASITRDPRIHTRSPHVTIYASVSLKFRMHKRPTESMSRQMRIYTANNGKIRKYNA